LRKRNKAATGERRASARSSVLAKKREGDEVGTPETLRWSEMELPELDLTRFRRTSEVDLIPGPEQGFDIVGGYFSADRKSFLFHSSNMHFHITRSSIAFLKKKVIFLC
jgi:hypothetical protein